jgi:pimeloyl-ACP methyl ester carboxylesterase
MKKTVRYKKESIISYAEFGEKTGYPIFINHGLIASIQDNHLFERLIRLGAHLVCIARPGYGESSPYRMKNILEWGDLVAIVVEELCLSRFDVLGMSSGAPYSYAMGYRFPERARNIYIFSGIPALYDEEILSHWPYEANKNASIAELEALAHELFFSDVSREDLERNDIKDSMMNHGFGLAQDFRLRYVDWGFRLSEVKQPVYMRHSTSDDAVPFITAFLTSKRLPNCTLQTEENGEHFSERALDDFIKTVITDHWAVTGGNP